MVSQIGGFALVAWGIILAEHYRHAWPAVQAVAWLDGVRNGALGNYLPWGMTGDFQPCAHIFVQPAFALTKRCVCMADETSITERKVDYDSGGSHRDSLSIRGDFMSSLSRSPPVTKFVHATYFFLTEGRPKEILQKLWQCVAILIHSLH